MVTKIEAASIEAPLEANLQDSKETYIRKALLDARIDPDSEAAQNKGSEAVRNAIKAGNKAFEASEQGKALLVTEGNVAITSDGIELWDNSGSKKDEIGVRRSTIQKDALHVLIDAAKEEGRSVVYLEFDDGKAYSVRVEELEKALKKAEKIPERIFADTEISGDTPQSTPETKLSSLSTSSTNRTPLDALKAAIPAALTGLLNPVNIDKQGEEGFGTDGASLAPATGRLNLAQLLDTNSDSKISADELKNLLNNDKESFLRALDGNGDGKVTKKEASEALANLEITGISGGALVQADALGKKLESMGIRFEKGDSNLTQGVGSNVINIAASLGKDTGRGA